MNAYKLLSKQECQEILNKVESQSEFEFKKVFKNFDFKIHSSNYSCDGFDFKKGDYFIGFNVNKNHGDMAGCGHPINADKFLLIFSSYQKALDYICENISQYADDEIIRESEQLSLFD